MQTSPAHLRDNLRLSDGRRLVFVVTGPEDGIPVVYCHGAIGTPLGPSVDLESMTYDLGVRHIAVSRPGIGGSDPSPGRTVLDFAADLRQLADALALERFAVVGVSAGGPYALAVGRELADRLTGLAVCSSLSSLCRPHQTPGMELRIRLALAFLSRAPRFCGALGAIAVPLIRRHPEMLSRVIAAHAAPSERRLLQTVDERAAASASFLDAADGGVQGMIEDYLTCSRPWGFAPSEVPVEVQLWHGASDPLVPIEHALQLAIALPRCRVFFDPDEGHHFFRRRLRQILAVLVGRQRGAETTVTQTLDEARELAARRLDGRRRRRG
jgi:pimeloyl-ACP methyl ester carboxylesterase